MYFKSPFSKQKNSTGADPAAPARTGMSSSARQGFSLAAASFMAAGLFTSASASAAYADEAVTPDSATTAPVASPAGPAPGTLLDATPAPHLLNLAGPQLPGAAQRIRYASIDSNGEPVEVTGYVIEPSNPWRGNGPTPTVVMAPGTRGSGDQCAPSAAPDLLSALNVQPNASGLPYLSLNANYELPLQYLANATGMRIISTDYMGMGTPGHHTYINTEEEAHAVLDGARAGLSAAGAPADSPVGFAGYSQGGGAVAAAAEYHASYAPELNLVGTFAGAPPADLRQVVESVDGSSIVAALGYTINGFLERHPELATLIEEEFNDEGKRFLKDAEISCIADGMINWGFTNTRTLTNSGESFAEIISRRPELGELIDEQKLGTRPLSAPMLVSNSDNDDLIPYAQAAQMARDYCAQGGQVEMRSTLLPLALPDLKPGVNHTLPLFTDMPQGLRYLTDRFNGLPPGNDCGTF